MEMVKASIDVEWVHCINHYLPREGDAVFVKFFQHGFKSWEIDGHDNNVSELGSVPNGEI
ncbi:unnamed protein product [Clonostachys byssicola]|uniref:Uncharacterized protein n=1 Tax=Clonostachys byssicola TaxID=160290 RepID=A0A9N9UE73_9HYPO|nr:unnamed protein product [Clonostachys byssicola]